ncbi:hypothetical protein GQ53DRAFT_818478 [Thozetella sp. PMI_491]|nr:hypothetical protein GQ53DRAFT_818478 [Thozetella sp. PMI_491]
MPCNLFSPEWSIADEWERIQMRSRLSAPIKKGIYWPDDENIFPGLMLSLKTSSSLESIPSFHLSETVKAAKRQHSSIMGLISGAIKLIVIPIVLVLVIAAVIWFIRVKKIKERDAESNIPVPGMLAPPPFPSELPRQPPPIAVANDPYKQYYHDVSSHGA